MPVRFRLPPGLCLGATLAVLAAVQPEPAVAARHPRIHDGDFDRPDGIHVLDGSYVINVGNMQVNITNHGLIGSHYSDFHPYSSAPSGQWPGGSGDEYLYAAGLWIGARVAGEPSVTTGQPQRELRPDEDIRATIYEASRGKVLRPVASDEITGRRVPDPLYDDDRDDAYDEDGLNGLDDDGDGLVDEDFGQFGDQMMVATMHDDTRLVQEIYPEHRPLGVTVVQRAAGWSDAAYDDFVALDFEIYNNSHHTLEDLYLGFYVDCDIQNRSVSHTQPDDLAGFYDGGIRGPDGNFQRLQIAWMRDGNEEDPLPGVFGVVLLDHTTDWSGWRAPAALGNTTYRRFSLNASPQQGGEPLSDADRYAMMSGTRFDRDTHDNEGDDYRFLIATGPFKYVEPQKVLRYRLALVAGTGMEEMLENAAHASALQGGAWFDADRDYFSGLGGRETLECFGDLPSVYGVRPLETYRAAIMDERCTGSAPRMGYTIIKYDESVFTGPDGRRCIWVNGDNCRSCWSTDDCDPGDEYWLPGTGPSSSSLFSTGYGGREFRAAWLFQGAVPPVAPGIRVEPGDGYVEIYWDNRSQFDIDQATGVIDFEAYRVWRVTNWKRPKGVDEDQLPPAEMWSMIAEFDLVNTVPADVGTARRETDLGLNTGLEVVSYRPVCLDDPRFAGVAEAMRVIVDADPRNNYVRLPSLRRVDGSPRAGFESLLPWEDHPAELDTFFAWASREPNPALGILRKIGRRYFRWVDHDVHNNFMVYYSVTSRDHSLAWHGGRWVPSGYGAEIAPGTNYTATRPRHEAQTAAQRDVMGTNIFVYPNPVTQESLDEFDRQETTWANPTGARIVWANLPAARNTIRIYTAAGDLVKTLVHDGTGGDGTAAWNLVTRNNQEIVPGIYIYVVQSDNSRFEDFVGRFVVIW